MRTVARTLATAFVIACFSVTTAAQVSFATTRYFVAEGTGGDVTTGDFNRDGMPDLAVGLGNNQVGVFLATAPGQYGAHTDYTVGSSPNRIVAADFDGDGVLDLLAGGDGGPLTLLLGNGDGTFRSGPTFPINGRLTGIAAGDFNRDGKVDVALAECNASGSGCTLTVYNNNGDGTFTFGQRLATIETYAVSVVAADFNRDGFLDIATEASQPARALVFFGDGSGGFSSAVTLSFDNQVPAGAGETIGGVVAADFNNDAVPDLAVMSGVFIPTSSGNDRANIFLSDGSGGFSFKTQFLLFGQTGGRFLATDLDGDLTQDLFYWNPLYRGGGSTFWLGTGDGSFTQASGSFAGSTTGAVEARDLNLDSRHDLVQTISFISSMVVGINTSAATNCAPPGSDIIRAKLCSPQPGATSSGSVTISGSGNSPAGIQRLELWIDGVKQYQTLNDQMLHSEQLSPGSHLIELVAVDRYVSFAKTSATVNVSASGGGDCVAPQGTVRLCSPANGSAASSPVDFSGGAVIPGLAYLRLYLDNSAVWEGPASSPMQFHVSLNVPAGDHRAVLVAYSGGTSDQTAESSFTVSSTVGGGGEGTCAATAGTVHLCLPANGSTLATPVEFAGAGALPGQTLLRLYLDDQPIFQTTAVSFDTTISVGAGNHHAVLVGYSSSGISGNKTDQSFFTVSGTGTIGCGLAATDQTILICYPGEGQTVSSPFQLQARARWDARGISHMRVYVDDGDVYDLDYPREGYISPTLSLAAGAHRIVIVAWNNAGTWIVSPTRNINVQ